MNIPLMQEYWVHIFLLFKYALFIYLFFLSPVANLTTIKQTGSRLYFSFSINTEWENDKACIFCNTSYHGVLPMKASLNRWLCFHPPWIFENWKGRLIYKRKRKWENIIQEKVSMMKLLRNSIAICVILSDLTRYCKMECNTMHFINVETNETETRV